MTAIIQKKDEQGSTERTKLPNWIAFSICVLGIYGSYFVFGIIQQQLNKATFGPDNKRFTNTAFLVFVQCVGNALCAIIAIVVTREPADKTPFTKYALISGSYVGAMFSSNTAIQFVSYPMMTLAKSCKPIPVLLMGVLVFGKKQTLAKYLCVFLVTIGISVFMWDELVHSKNSVETSTIGIIYLAASLAMDGITGPFQDNLVHEYQPSAQAMMFYTNVWAAIYLGIGLIFTGKGAEGFSFLLEFPDVLPSILFFSVASAIGQNFIYYTIKRFGSLICSLITTTRKFFSILISSLLFGDLITPIMWVGVSIVFVGLGIDIYSSTKSKKKAE